MNDPTRRPWARWDRAKVVFAPPVSDTGDRDRDALLAALAAVEVREGERRGWDKHPRLMTLHLADIDSCAIGVRIVPTHIWRSGQRNPADDLMLRADKIPAPRTDPFRAFADSPDGFCGMAFMSEGWSVHPDQYTPDQLARANAGERVNHTHPDRVECRFVTAVDINGRVYHVFRVRGEEPKTRTLETDKGRLPWALGRIASNLRDGGTL
ncbi:MAG: hypothetical protein JWP40_3984 [Blastococcus sp.]|jgi:hypothetical protein|nr:hypothetical protein [Blastococcus sp.]